jgi:hypothetical protein
MRSTAPRLDGTTAFMVWFCFFFFAIFVGYLIRDNPVYHVFILARLRSAVSTGVIHTWGLIRPSLHAMATLDPRTDHEAVNILKAVKNLY